MKIDKNIIFKIWILATEVARLKQADLGHFYSNYSSNKDSLQIETVCEQVGVDPLLKEKIMQKNVSVLTAIDFQQCLAVFQLLKSIKDRLELNELAASARHPSGIEPNKQLTNEKK